MTRTGWHDTPYHSTIVHSCFDMIRHDMTLYTPLMTRHDTTRHSFPPDSFVRHLPLPRLCSSRSFLLPIPSLFHAPLVPRVVDATRPAASLRHVFTHHLSSLSFSPCVTLCHTHCGTRSPFLFPFCLSRCHPASLMVTLHPNAD